MARAASYHAVYYVLNDADFFTASLASVYEHITGATVITQYDRDRWQRPVAPDRILDLILSRDVDPDRKVDVIISTDDNEPRLRNRAIAESRLPRDAQRVADMQGRRVGHREPDFLWHIDADEIYADDDIPRLKEYVQSHRATAYLLELRTYFRTWNWRIAEKGTFVAVSRPGFWFGHVRHEFPTLRHRAAMKLARNGSVSESNAVRLLGHRLVPPEVAVCHHGSYVGDRARIAEKFVNSAHAEQMVEGWLERVWDEWHPDMTDFHPTRPERFPRAEHVRTEDLPRAIRRHRWPSGWIEPSEPALGLDPTHSA